MLPYFYNRIFYFCATVHRLSVSYGKTFFFTLLNELEIRSHIDSWYSFFLLSQLTESSNIRLINDKNINISCLNVIIGTNKKKNTVFTYQSVSIVSFSHHFFSNKNTHFTVHIKLIASVNLKYWIEKKVLIRFVFHLVFFFSFLFFCLSIWEIQ